MPSRKSAACTMSRAAIASAVLASLVSVEVAGATPPAEDFAAGRILLMPKAGLPDAALARILKDNGGGNARRIGQGGLRLIELKPGQEKQMVARLQGHPHIKFAELDQKAKAVFVPNDPYLGSEWHIAKINASAAWDYATGAGVTIAIIDTGVEATHPDLASQLVAGYNFYDNNTNTSPVNGHGTWVAGTAAGTINNGLGVAAVAGNAKIMPLRVVDSAGVGYWSSIASAITYAADKGARVANASFENLLSSSSVLSAAAYMKSKNGLVVIAAGNSGTNPGLTPSTSVISVSATDSNDAFCTWSSYGNYVTVSAPGTPIYTTGLGGTYVQVKGTSFSSPIVAGTIALMMTANPKLANTEIEKLLYSTSVDLGAAGRDIYYGYGRVDAGAAVKAAVEAVNVTDTVAPTVVIGAPLASSSVSGLVPISVSATDNVGVASVQLRVNGALLGTDTAAPYSFSWDSATVPNGMATISATSFDAAGNASTAYSVSVNVSNAVINDVTPPSVTITNPKASTRLRGSVTISATASDNSGTAGITQSLYIDDGLVAKVAGGSLSYSWNLKRVAAGTHAIRVVAIDAAGNTSTATSSVTK